MDKFFTHWGWVSFLLFSLKIKGGERKGKKGKEREKKKEGRIREEREEFERS